MSQSGYTPILIYGSGTAANVPLAANLTSSASGAELALNYADGKLYYKNSSNVVTLLASTAGASGDVVGPASATANGIALFNSTTGKLIKDSAASDGLIYGLTVGRGAGAVATNTAVGASALASNSGGTNTAIGSSALFSNTTGNASTAVGYQAGYSNTSGDVAALGYSALKANTTGTGGVAMGDSALLSNTTGNFNIGLGTSALRSNTTASSNTAVGYEAAYTNTTGTNIVAMGFRAHKLGTTGTENTAIGTEALRQTTTGSYNTAVGSASSILNTTGSNNTSLGYWSLFNNTTASNNTAVGYQAGYSNTTSAGNTLIGHQAGYTQNNTGGNAYNTFIGYQAGYGVTTGYSNVFIGANSGTAAGSGSLVTTGYNNVIIGGYTGSAAPISATGNGYIVLSDGAGNVRQTIDSSGNVGIGTSSPSGKLHVAGGANSNDFLTSSTGTTYLIMGNVDGGANAKYSYVAAASQYLLFGKVNDDFATRTEYMRIDNSGSVMAGTTTASGSAGGFTVATTTSGSVTTPIAMRNAGTANGTGVALSFRGLTNASAEADYAYLTMVADDTTAKTGSIRFSTVNGASPVERMRIDTVGNVQVQSGAVMPYAPAPAAISAAATLTNANIQGQIISATGTTYTITMPLGTTMETLATWATTNIAYDFFVINTASGTVTMAVNTGVTSLGSLTVAIGASAHFRIRRTAANTFVLYRLV